jgi:4-hydroxy-tetrahydrodipicolinate reductase
LKKDENNTYDGLANADVAIDFSIPNAAVLNITNCLNENVPVISGTTGWLEHIMTRWLHCAIKLKEHLFLVQILA